MHPDQTVSLDCSCSSVIRERSLKYFLVQRDLQDILFLLTSGKCASIIDPLFKQSMHTDWCGCASDEHSITPAYVLPSSLARIELFWRPSHTGQSASPAREATLLSRNLNRAYFQDHTKRMMFPRSSSDYYPDKETGKASILRPWNAGFDTLCVTSGRHTFRLPFKVNPHPGHMYQFCQKLIQSLDLNHRFGCLPLITEWKIISFRMTCGH